MPEIEKKIEEEAKEILEKELLRYLKQRISALKTHLGKDRFLLDEEQIYNAEKELERKESLFKAISYILSSNTNFKTELEKKEKEVVLMKNHFAIMSKAYSEIRVKYKMKKQHDELDEIVLKTLQDYNKLQSENNKLGNIIKEESEIMEERIKCLDFGHRENNYMCPEREYLQSVITRLKKLF